MVITIYTKPGCFGCRKTAEKFTDIHIDFTEMDVIRRPAALEYVTEELGYSRVPIVVDDDFHGCVLNPSNVDLAKEAVAS